VEAAKLAPRQDHDLALVHKTALQKGNRNRATLAVGRKMVAYLLAMDRETVRRFVSSNTTICGRRKVSRAAAPRRQ